MSRGQVFSQLYHQHVFLCCIFGRAGKFFSQLYHQHFFSIVSSAFCLSYLVDTSLASLLIDHILLPSWFQFHMFASGLTEHFTCVAIPPSVTPDNENKSSSRSSTSFVRSFLQWLGILLRALHLRGHSSYSCTH